MELEKDTNTDRLMGLDEVAERLGTSQNVVGKILNAGLLPFLRFGRVRRVPCSGFNEFVTANVGRDVLEAIKEHKVG